MHPAHHDRGETYRGPGIGRWLCARFEERARDQGCTALKAITPPINTESIALHRRLGFELLGEPNDEGIAIVADHFGPGMPRVVFLRSLRVS